MTPYHTDSLWLRAFWHIYTDGIPGEVIPAQQTGTVEFADVDALVLKWSQMPIDQLLQMLGGEITVID